MTTATLIKSFVTAALLASVTANAADNTIAIAMEEGKQVASFSLGDARCVLKNDQIRCAPAGK